MPINPFTVRAAGVSDAGRVRQDNEDNCLVSLEQQLYIVSDGIGGHQAGSIASNIVVSVLPQLIQQRLARVTSPRNRIVELILRETILELSQKLHAESKTKSGLQGMGATVALAYLRYENNFAHLAHMGDSRIYLFRHDRLLQLTEDHSLVTLLVQHGEITPSQVQDHPASGRLSRYVGMEGEVYPDVQSIALLEGDMLLLCSDGLTGMLSDKHIAQILKANPNPEETCNILVDTANEAGGKDNITAVVVNMGDTNIEIK